MDDPYDLQRFVDAQNPVFEQACAELRAGQKHGHWMWFIFPQVRGARLRECTQLVMLVEGRSINQIFGSPDDLKFRSSMTLFASTTSTNQTFKDALQKYFAGELDRLTVERL